MQENVAGYGTYCTQKIARLYGNWFHISEIPKGAKSLEITLNSNDHRPFFANNVVISSIIALENES